MLEQETDTRLYRAVVNHEEQYSIWFADRDIPNGWRDAGKIGTKDECLDFIESVWTDMRPLSLRKKMEADADERASCEVEQEGDDSDRSRSLAERLSEGRHPVRFHSQSTDASEDLRARIDRGLVLIEFTGTNGGTELGVPLDASATGFTCSGSESKVHIEGELSLDFRRVRCIVDLNLASLEGEGYLILID